MGSRKIILRSLVAGQQWRCRHRKQTCGYVAGVAEGGGGRTGRVVEKHIHYHMQERQSMGICL